MPAPRSSSRFRRPQRRQADVIRGSPTPTVTIYATGFNNPRGLKFGPDGMLYVAEGGVGGTDSTEGECTQVIPPIGPYTGSSTGSQISRVENGVRVTFNDKFPSSQTSALTGNLVSGVADIAWIGGTMYALTAGGGCSHGVLGHPNGVYRVNGNNTPTLVANLSAFYQSHPVANPEEDDFEPDGTPYSMIASGGSLYVVEPNHGELDRVSTSGSISRVADISATQGHIVPTAIAQRGVFYIGNLNTFPIVPGSSKILRVTLGGQVQTVATGLTTVARGRVRQPRAHVCPREYGDGGRAGRRRGGDRTVHGHEARNAGHRPHAADRDDVRP